MAFESTRVVIVGAGPSGLAAASRLIKSGVNNVTILEAADRIGGRVHSVNADYKSPNTTADELNHTIEFGAQWVHGIDGNISYKLASEKQLLENVDIFESTMPGEFEKLTLISDDPKMKVDTKEMEKLVNEVYHRADNIEAPSSETHGNFFTKTFEELIQDKDDNYKQSARMFQDFYHRLIRNVEGCTNWNDLSFEGSLKRYHKCPGKSRIPYKSQHKHIDLINVVAENIPEKDIILNSPVEKINRENPMKILVSGGQEYKADFVIFTASLGVLKAIAGNLFEPPLPESKLQSIETIGIGSVNKIFLEFEKAWWPEKSTYGFGFMYSASGLNGCDFKYTKEDAEKDWTRFLLGAYRVDNRPRLLCFWVSGEGAKKMETLSNDQIQDGCMRTLRKFIQKDFPNIPDPVSIKVTRWFSNPWTRGSYSYQTQSSEMASITPDDLAEPVGNLLFAGEATHTQYFSCVHGAIESGYREAERILTKIGSN